MNLIKNALVIGGGFGGMTAAIQLRKIGVAVDLIEINPKWAPDGAGITISGPTLRALKTVGVVDEVLARGGSWTHIDICDASGTLIRTVQTAHAFGAEDIPPTGGILRSVLADILANATRSSGVNVRLGLSFSNLVESDSQVEVHFTDGTCGVYDLVIGADGVNSKVRSLIMPKFEGPKFTGQGSWRAVVPRTRKNSTIYMGRTTKAGLNPISDSECYLFTLDRRQSMDFIEQDKWASNLAELLAEFGGEVAHIRDGLIKGTLNNPRIVYRPLAGHIIDGPWHRGRIVLIGDTVHATTPHLASGAGLAIEGAIVLIDELSKRHCLEGALIGYCGRHYDRARLVVSASGRMGELEQQGGSQEEHRELMIATQEALRAQI